MHRIFAFPMSPANYTLDIIENVYKPKGIRYAFVHGSSEASDRGCRDALVLEQNYGWCRRILTIKRILNENDIFIVNSYTDKISLAIILVNILFFKKPMGISSDTQLRIPRNIIHRFMKYILLGVIFKRKYIYGLPGGTKSHFELFLHYGMSASRITVLPMMVNNAKYHRDNIETPTDVFRFVYVGRLIPCKRVGEIVKAFAELCKTMKRVELHIIGDGIEREALERQAVGQSVIFHGRRRGEQLVGLLHKMHCLILYSCFEQWGLVVNEALASGVPCIVSEEVGARFDLVEAYPPAGIVAKEGVALLADTMRKIALNREKWKQYSENALARMSDWNYGKYQKQLDCFVKRTEGAMPC